MINQNIWKPGASAPEHQWVLVKHEGDVWPDAREGNYWINSELLCEGTEWSHSEQASKETYLEAEGYQ